MAIEPDLRILVEGDSDKHAVETIARRRGLDARRLGIAVIATHGVTNFAAHLGDPATALGLYDLPELDVVARALGRTTPGDARDRRTDLEAHGFFACIDDLEDEMLRAIGTDRVLALVAEHGEMTAFETMQRQPQWRGRPVHAQLHRFIGTKSGRKKRFGRLFAETVDLDAVPAPLTDLLDAALTRIRDR